MDLVYKVDCGTIGGEYAESCPGRGCHQPVDLSNGRPVGSCPRTAVGFAYNGNLPAMHLIAEHERVERYAYRLGDCPTVGYNCVGIVTDMQPEIQGSI